MIRNKIYRIVIENSIEGSAFYAVLDMRDKKFVPCKGINKTALTHRNLYESKSGLDANVDFPDLIEEGCLRDGKVIMLVPLTEPERMDFMRSFAHASPGFN